MAGIYALILTFSKPPFAFGGITGCGSASLKLCACDTAYPWSQCHSPDSQWGHHVCPAHLGLPPSHPSVTFDRDTDVQIFFLIPNRANEETSRKQKSLA